MLVTDSIILLACIVSVCTYSMVLKHKTVGFYGKWIVPIKQYIPPQMKTMETVSPILMYVLAITR